eukprot:1505602-Amphidinium_carterae.1
MVLCHSIAKLCYSDVLHQGCTKEKSSHMVAIHWHVQSTLVYLFLILTLQLKMRTIEWPKPWVIPPGAVAGGSSSSVEVRKGVVAPVRKHFAHWTCTIIVYASPSKSQASEAYPNVSSSTAVAHLP